MGEAVGVPRLGAAVAQVFDEKKKSTVTCLLIDKHASESIWETRLKRTPRRIFSCAKCICSIHYANGLYQEEFYRLYVLPSFFQG